MILQPSARLFSPCDDERQPSKPATARETTEGPLRKAAAPVPRRNRARVTRLEKPSHPPEAPLKPHLRLSSGSSEGEHGSRLRSSQKGGAVQKALSENGAAHVQTKETVRKTRKQQRDGKKPPVASSRRERSASASRCSPAASDTDTDDQPPPDELIATRSTQRRNGVRRHQEEESQHSVKVTKKKASRPPRSGGAAKATEEKRSKAGKTSGRVKPTQSSRRRKADSRLEEEDEEAKQDKWTESELMKLDEYVALAHTQSGGKRPVRHFQ